MEADINQIEKRLSDILEKERREAIGYAVLTVLCTPFFVVITAILPLLIVGFVLHGVGPNKEITADRVYTLINCFLALMLLIVLRYTFSPDSEYEFNVTWLVALIIFLLLMFLTYGTDIMETNPLFFGIIYTLTGYYILGLLGRVYLDLPTVDYGNKDIFGSFVLLVAGFIARAYGEVFSGSWLWSAPDKDKISMCAWFLLRLEKEKFASLQNNKVERPVLRILFRLKLIERKEDWFRLSQKGQNFITVGFY